MKIVIAFGFYSNPMIDYEKSSSRKKQVKNSFSVYFTREQLIFVLILAVIIGVLLAIRISGRLCFTLF